MFRHCVMFKWKPDTDDETKAQIAAGLDEMAKLADVTAYKHGPDARLSDGNWDYVVVGDFLSATEYQRYAVEPSHVQLVKSLIAPNIDARAAVQYELS